MEAFGNKAEEMSMIAPEDAVGEPAGGKEGAGGVTDGVDMAKGTAVAVGTGGGAGVGVGVGEVAPKGLPDGVGAGAGG